MHDLSRPAKRSTRWLLNSLHAQDLPASTPINEDGVTLGRDDDNTVSIPAHLFPGVSGQHARLSIVENELVLEDLGSSNGTFIEGRSIEREALKHGAIFELGSGGPKFIVVSAEKLDKTVTMPRPVEVAERASGSIGADTMHLVRENLGIPDATSVEQMVSRRTRRTRLMMLGLLLVLVVASGVTFKILNEREQANQAIRASELLEWEANREADRLAWEGEKATLETQRAELQAAIAAIQTDEESTTAELQRLRGRLDDTNSTLEMFNPLNLAQRELQEVSRVERSTVLIEADQYYVDRTTGRTLHALNDGAFGSRLNLDGLGEPLMVEATGSGFALTSDGWIITNAHVVHKKHEEKPINMGPNVELEARINLRVVFSGESERHEATLIKWVSDGREDLALLKIEPFEGMPFLEPPLLNAPPPLRGTEVYLIGFPLGKRVFHQGDTMLASTFKGVLSRVLDEYLQVDAAVHPGASGGPLIDGKGRLLGVVVGMQTTDDRAASSAIGYIIPITSLNSVWPPPEPR